MEEIRLTKGKALNRDQIKYIAVILMALNHIASIFLKEGTVAFLLLRNLGYFTAPVMCYFLVEGYYYTHSRKQYGQRLLLFALLSQIPFQIAFGEEQSWRLVRGNMILTLFICFLILVCLDERHVLLATVLIFLTAFCDWGMATPLMVILFRNSRMNQKKRMRDFFIASLVLFEEGYMEAAGAAGIRILYAFWECSAVLLAGLVIVYLYNGEKGSSGSGFSRWFFYIFYPAHLLWLGVMRLTMLV